MLLLSLQWLIMVADITVVVESVCTAAVSVGAVASSVSAAVAVVVDVGNVNGRRLELEKLSNNSPSK